MLGKDSSGFAELLSETTSLVDLMLGSESGKAFFNLLLRLVTVSSFSRESGVGLPGSSPASGCSVGLPSVPVTLQPDQNKEISKLVFCQIALWVSVTGSWGQTCQNIHLLSILGF